MKLGVNIICHLAEHKGLLVPNRVQRVVRCFGSVFPFSVSGKSKHVHLHINSNLLIAQKLTGDDLCMRLNMRV